MMCYSEQTKENEREYYPLEDRHYSGLTAGMEL